MPLAVDSEVTALLRETTNLAVQSITLGTRYIQLAQLHRERLTSERRALGVLCNHEHGSEVVAAAGQGATWTLVP